MDCMSVLVKFHPIMTIPRPNGLAICVFGLLSPFDVSLLDLIDLKNMATCILIMLMCASNFSPFRHSLDPIACVL